MAVIGRLVACVLLCVLGARMVVHSPEPDLFGIAGAVLCMIGLIGMVEIALGET